MDKPINLSRFRKEKARADKRVQGDANAAKFGRTKAQKDADALNRERAEKTLDRHKREE